MTDEEVVVLGRTGFDRGPGSTARPAEDLSIEILGLAEEPPVWMPFSSIRWERQIEWTGPTVPDPPDPRLNTVLKRTPRPQRPWE